MAREHKLILIIGFSLFLVVAVLISDHMSQARMARLAPAEEVDTSLPGRQAISLLEVDTKPLKPDASDSAPLGGQSGLQSVQIQDDQDSGWGGLGGASYPEDDSPLSGSGHTAPVIIEMGEGNRRTGGLVNEITNPAPNPDLERLRQQYEDEKQAIRVAAEREQTHRDARPAVPLEYIVQPNDSLYKIAERFYGDGNRWHEIAQANKGKVGENGSVRVGIRLHIPPNNVILRAEDLDRTPKSTPKPSPKTTTPKQGGSKPSGERRYTVKPGDSLGMIASRELGTVKRQKEILELNKGKISDADEIYVGMVLSLPAS